jgi:hypothetical protein
VATRPPGTAKNRAHLVGVEKVISWRVLCGWDRLSCIEFDSGASFTHRVEERVAVFHDSF